MKQVKTCPIIAPGSRFTGAVGVRVRGNWCLCRELYRGWAPAMAVCDTYQTSEMLPPHR